ncbi:hypothetical protein CEXT_12281 [Caerostris extrusa]|uniref:Uncharacterized protein n=1 Tax=Caerostris extrusa TaxID=172846 RepID=A0AAV4SKS7_CAEEX|nr:hypothetical protein CEXT_12281 [Caerostris extrusa]
MRGKIECPFSDVTPLLTLRPGKARALARHEHTSGNAPLFWIDWGGGDAKDDDTKRLGVRGGGGMLNSFRGSGKPAGGSEEG